MVPLAAAARQESGTGSVLEHLSNALVGLGRALKVFVGTNRLALLLTLWKYHVSETVDVMYFTPSMLAES